MNAIFMGARVGAKAHRRKGAKWNRSRRSPLSLCAYEPMSLYAYASPMTFDETYRAAFGFTDPALDVGRVSARVLQPHRKSRHSVARDGLVVRPRPPRQGARSHRRAAERPGDGLQVLRRPPHAAPRL